MGLEVDALEPVRLLRLATTGYVPEFSQVGELSFELCRVFGKVIAEGALRLEDPSDRRRWLWREPYPGTQPEIHVRDIGVGIKAGVCQSVLQGGEPLR